MPRGRTVSPEQIIAKLRQIEGQLAQGMSLALACKEGGLSEQTQGRVLEAGDLLQSQGGSGRDRRLARPLQSGSAALLLGLPATRARDPRLCQPPTHVTDHAVVSQNSVQNPAQVSRKPVVTAEVLCKARALTAQGLNVREATARLKVAKTAPTKHSRYPLRK